MNILLFFVIGFILGFVSFGFIVRLPEVDSEDSNDEK